MARRTGWCTYCDQWRTQYGHLNLCSACYGRWLNAGRPDTGPPAAKPARPFTPEEQQRSVAIRRANHQNRIDDYAFLLSAGETREGAAARVGVCARTAERYERILEQETAA
jgi:hypothetical protein